MNNRKFISFSEKNLLNLVSQEKIILTFLRVERNFHAKKKYPLSDQIKEIFIYLYPELLLSIKTKKDMFTFLRKYKLNKKLAFKDYNYRGSDYGLRIDSELSKCILWLIDSLSNRHIIKNEAKSSVKKIFDIIDLRLRKNFPKSINIVGLRVFKFLLLNSKSFKKLSRLSSSKIQVLGAEKALFRHIRKNSPSPKYGYIYYTISENFNNCRQLANNKGKIAKKLANAFLIAYRQDYFNLPYEENRHRLRALK